MLRFQYLPDKVFTKIITMALEETLDSVKHAKDMSDLIHLWDAEINQAFSTPKFLQRVLQSLLKAHKSKDLYMPTDWHFLLLDRILHSWCDCYNDMLLDEECSLDKNWSLRDKKGNEIRHIDFNLLMDTFFWDTDYDIDTSIASELRGSEVQSISDVSDPALNASLRLPVDLNDLVFKKYDKIDRDPIEGEWWDTKSVEEDIESL